MISFHCFLKILENGKNRFLCIILDTQIVDFLTDKENIFKKYSIFI